MRLLSCQRQLFHLSLGTSAKAGARLEGKGGFGIFRTPVNIISFVIL